MFKLFNVSASAPRARHLLHDHLQVRAHPKRGHFGQYCISVAEVFPKCVQSVRNSKREFPRNRQTVSPLLRIRRRQRIEHLALPWNLATPFAPSFRGGEGRRECSDAVPHGEQTGMFRMLKDVTLYQRHKKSLIFKLTVQEPPQLLFLRHSCRYGERVQRRGILHAERGCAGSRVAVGRTHVRVAVGGVLRCLHSSCLSHLAASSGTLLPSVQCLPRCCHSLCIHRIFSG